MKSQPRSAQLYPQCDIMGAGVLLHMSQHILKRAFVSTLRCSPQQMCAKSHARPTKAGGGVQTTPKREVATCGENV